MDTVIERDNGMAAVTLLLGILGIAVIGGLALYFLQIYPFSAEAQKSGTEIDITLPLQPASSDSTSY